MRLWVFWGGQRCCNCPGCRVESWGVPEGLRAEPSTTGRIDRFRWNFPSSLSKSGVLGSGPNKPLTTAWVTQAERLGLCKMGSVSPCVLCEIWNPRMVKKSVFYNLCVIYPPLQIYNVYLHSKSTCLKWSKPEFPKLLWPWSLFFIQHLFTFTELELRTAGSSDLWGSCQFNSLGSWDYV